MSVVLCVCVCVRARVCAGLWLITSNIVLLNMFIAILSEAYRKVGEEVQLVYMDVPTCAHTWMYTQVHNHLDGTMCL